jgi:hypothetical protein
MFVFVLLALSVHLYVSLEIYSAYPTGLSMYRKNIVLFLSEHCFLQAA